MKKLLVTMMMAVFAFAGPAAAADGEHKLVLQISDNNPQKMQTVLNVASQITKTFEERGETIEVEVVAFNLGLHMYRADTAPEAVQKRLKIFAESMHNVQFLACGNTMKRMTKKEGAEPVLLEMAEVIPAGVERIILRDEAGWTVIRP